MATKCPCWQPKMSLDIDRCTQVGKKDKLAPTENHPRLMVLCIYSLGYLN